MWYTVLLVADILAIWLLGTLLLYTLQTVLIALGIPVLAIVAWLVQHALTLGVPSQLVSLLGFAPHIALYFTYVALPVLPQSPAFCHWPGWDQARQRWYPITYKGVPKTLDKDAVCIYAVSPHGVFGAAAILSFVLTRRFPGVRPVATSLLFWMPGAREFAALAGAIPATSGAITDALDAGESLVLLPEGLRGLLHPDDPLVVLRRRRGFIRCALASRNRGRIHVVPVHIEGANALYYVVNVWRGFQGWLLHHFYYPWPVLAFGAYYVTPLPRPGPLEVRFGKPIAVQQYDDVDEISARYCAAIEGLRN